MFACCASQPRTTTGEFAVKRAVSTTVKQIIVTHRQLVDTVTFVMSDGTSHTWGTESETAQRDVVDLQEDEVIIEVQQRTGIWLLDAITFNTSSGRVLTFGGSGGSLQEPMKAGPWKHIIRMIGASPQQFGLTPFTSIWESADLPTTPKFQAAWFARCMAQSNAKLRSFSLGPDIIADDKVKRVVSAVMDSLWKIAGELAPAAGPEAVGLFYVFDTFKTALKSWNEAKEKDIDKIKHMFDKQNEMLREMKSDILGIVKQVAAEVAVHQAAIALKSDTTLIYKSPNEHDQKFVAVYRSLHLLQTALDHDGRNAYWPVCLDHLRKQLASEERTSAETIKFLLSYLAEFYEHIRYQTDAVAELAEAALKHAKQNGSDLSQYNIDTIVQVTLDIEKQFEKDDPLHQKVFQQALMFAMSGDGLCKMAWKAAHGAAAERFLVRGMIFDQLGVDQMGKWDQNWREAQEIRDDLIRERLFDPADVNDFYEMAKNSAWITANACADSQWWSFLTFSNDSDIRHFEEAADRIKTRGMVDNSKLEKYKAVVGAAGRYAANSAFQIQYDSELEAVPPGLASLPVQWLFSSKTWSEEAKKDKELFESSMKTLRALLPEGSPS